MLAVAGMAAIGLSTTPAAAETTAPAESGDASWAFVERDHGSWRVPDVGADSHPAPDGSVLGWRLAHHGDLGPQAVHTPRDNVSFEQPCGKVRPVPGRKRVALVVDAGPQGLTTTGAASGTTDPADRGITMTATCVVVAPQATARDVLHVAENELVALPIGEPPAGRTAVETPAGERVAPTLTEPAGDTSVDTPAWAWVGIGVMVVALGGAARTVTRRRATGTPAPRRP